MQAGILQRGASEEKGQFAKLSNIIGATGIADIVKSTLGPKGMDKILISMQSGDISITNDGATILDSLRMVDNPAAKILIEISKGQDKEVGDGTTTVCVLAGELLREAEKLLEQKIHPMTIIQGYRMASKVALDAFERSCFETSDPDAFRQDLLNIARTTLSSKVLNFSRDHFAEIAVDAVLRLQGSTDLSNISILKKEGGSLLDSFLSDGILLDKKVGMGQPKVVEKPRIFVTHSEFDNDRIKMNAARMEFRNVEEQAALERAEVDRMVDKVDKICKDTGANVVVAHMLIYDLPRQLFAERKVMAIEHADFKGAELIAGACDADIVSSMDDVSLKAAKLGTCERVDQVMIGEDRFIRFSGLPKRANACSIVLRGASKHFLDEAERSLHDALAVLSQTVAENRMSYGGGSAEMLMACAVDQEAQRTTGKQQLAMEAFSRALRNVIGVIAENGGYDAIELVSQLRATHNQGQTTAGLNMSQGSIADMKDLKVMECAKIKYHAVTAATEAAEMILRVDDIIRCPPRPRAEQ